LSTVLLAGGIGPFTRAGYDNARQGQNLLPK